MRLIDADELKEYVKKIEDYESAYTICSYIDNMPTVEEVTKIEFEKPLPLVKAQKIIKALNKKSSG